MTSLPLTPPEYLSHLRELTGDFAAVLAKGDPVASVPCCGEWTLADLGTHLGNVHRWAATVVESGEAQRQNFETPPDADLPEWYAEGASILLDALARAEPGAPCWHFAGTPRIKAFWFRRQVHETAVHLVDAHRAADGTPVLPPRVAADGVDEVLTAMLPRVTRWYSAPPLPEPLTLRATDTGHEWTLHPADPPALGPATTTAATAAASAQDLLHLLWKRSALTDVTLATTGAAGVAEGFLTAPMTP